MKQRILVGLALIAVILPIFMFGGWPFRILVFAFLMFSLYETYAVKKEKWPIWTYLLMIAAFILFSTANFQNLFVYFILFLIALFIITIQFEWFTPMDVTYFFTMVILLTSATRAIFLAMPYGKMLLLYLLIVTYLTDTAAYFSGYFFGKHKLNERISPKKTVEGSIGGWLISALGSMIFAYFFVKTIDFNFMVLCSIVLPLAAQVGDLAFSAIKRYFDVKDFGTIFAAHGGVLDRVDSLIFTLVVFYSLVMIILY